MFFELIPGPATLSCWERCQQKDFQKWKPFFVCFLFSQVDFLQWRYSVYKAQCLFTAVRVLRVLLEDRIIESPLFGPGGQGSEVQEVDNAVQVKHAWCTRRLRTPQKMYPVRCTTNKVHSYPGHHLQTEEKKSVVWQKHHRVLHDIVADWSDGLQVGPPSRVFEAEEQRWMWVLFATNEPFCDESVEWWPWMFSKLLSWFQGVAKG